MSDLIERQAVIELIHSLYPSVPFMRRNRERWEKRYKSYIEAEKALEQLPSAQPEPTVDAEFWRKRADFYSNMCMDLIGEMGRGGKIESVKISENGIEFIKKQPPAQPEIIYCKDCKHYKAYEYTGRLACHYVIGVTTVRNLKDFCSRAERRTDE